MKIIYTYHWDNMTVTTSNHMISVKIVDKEQNLNHNSTFINQKNRSLNKHFVYELNIGIRSKELDLHLSSNVWPVCLHSGKGL